MARLLAALSAAGNRGLSKRRLMESMNLDYNNASDKRKFDRYRADLIARGWDIESEETGVNEHRYQLKVIDNRIRESFSEAERAELFRVAQLAGLGGLYDDLQPDESEGSFVPNAKASHEVETARYAVQYQCLLTFVYHGRQRLVHPHEVVPKADRWMLGATEDGDSVLKKFYIDEILDLELAAPGSALLAPAVPTPGTNDPLLFAAHTELDVLVAAQEIDIEDVRSSLGSGGYSIAEPRQPDGSAIITVKTTNLPGLLMRMFELGPRVRLVGPAQVEAAARDKLVWALREPA